MSKSQSEIDFNFRKFKINNTKKLSFTRSAFQGLARIVTGCISEMANYHPAENDPSALRRNYQPLYAWLRVQMSDLLEFDAEQELLSGVTIAKISLINGVIDLRVSYTHNRVTKHFNLVCCNEGAPYDTKWPELLQGAGGDSSKFEQLLEAV